MNTREQYAPDESPATKRQPVVLMLLSNAYDPDPRVRQEALALLAAGYRVRLFAWDRDFARPESEVMDGVEVQRIFLRSLHGRGDSQVFFYAIVYLKLFARLLFARFDVVHCHDLDTLPLGVLLGKLRRKPIVYDAHESFPDMLRGSVRTSVIRFLSNLETFLLRRVDLVITVGEKLRSFLASRSNVRSVVIGNWKRLADYVRSDSENRLVRESLGIPGGALFVICITQLLPDRHLEELLFATRQIESVYALIGGKGKLAERVIAEAKTNPRVKYVGFVDAAAIAKFTSASDVVFYGFDPSNPNARFSAPNKLFEALAAGKPLITANFGEIGEIVCHAECGIILNEYTPSEICRALRELSEPEVLTRLSANSKSFGSSHLNWENGIQILQREYSGLLAKAGVHLPAVELGTYPSPDTPILRN